MSQEGDNAFGYFNENGSFVVERYNPSTDAVEKQFTNWRCKVKRLSSRIKCKFIYYPHN